MGGADRHCGVVAGGLVAASGFFERLVCGSPNRPPIVDALGFLGFALFMPACFTACVRGLHCAVHCDPDNAKHEKDETKAGWEEQGDPGTLKLMVSPELLGDLGRLRTEQQDKMRAVKTKWWNWVQCLILARWIGYTTFLLVVAYGFAELLTLEEGQQGSIGRAAQTYLTAVGPAGQCGSGSMLTVLTPRLFLILQVFIVIPYSWISLVPMYAWLLSLAAGVIVAHGALEVVACRIKTTDEKLTTAALSDDEWKLAIQRPTVSLVHTMDKLSAWGFGMGGLVLGAWGASSTPSRWRRPLTRAPRFVCRHVGVSHPGFCRKQKPFPRLLRRVLVLPAVCCAVGTCEDLERLRPPDEAPQQAAFRRRLGAQGPCGAPVQHTA